MLFWGNFPVKTEISAVVCCSRSVSCQGGIGVSWEWLHHRTRQQRLHQQRDADGGGDGVGMWMADHGSAWSADPADAGVVRRPGGQLVDAGRDGRRGGTSHRQRCLEHLPRGWQRVGWQRSADETSRHLWTWARRPTTHSTHSALPLWLQQCCNEAQVSHQSPTHLAVRHQIWRFNNNNNNSHIYDFL